MIFAVILAGGRGTRMQSATLPKQFLDLGGEPILCRTLKQFFLCRQIDGFIVAVPQDWLEYTRKLLANQRVSIHVCEGGQTRQESLYKAVQFLTSVFPVTDEDIILSHDAVRPFVSLRIIEDNIRTMSHYDAATTVIPAIDTIVESDAGVTVDCIQDRKRMYQCQTPQTFRRLDWLAIYPQLDAETLERSSDAARILAEHGKKVALVRGDQFNFKITTQEDLCLANFWLEKSA